MRVADRDAGSIGLGTAPFAFGSGSPEDSVATVHAALDAGVRFIDTALAYNRAGEASYAESIVARALRGSTVQPIVATKGGHWRDGNSFPVDGSPTALRRHLEISLRTLEVDTIDLYQLHHVDPSVPLAESVGALVDFQREGKFRSIGLSNVTIAQLEGVSSFTQIDTVQNRLSMSTPSDLPMARYCTEHSIAYLAYMPLHSLPELAERQAVRDIALRHEVSAAQVALAWLLAQSPAILPLVGSTRPESIIDSAGAADLHLDPQELRALDDAA